MSTKTIYKYIDIEKAKEQLKDCIRYEIKENEHKKQFALFYNDIGDFITERLCRTTTDKQGNKKQMCYSQDFKPNTTVETDFTKSFTCDRGEVLDLFNASSYIMNTEEYTLTANNSRKYKVEYLNEEGEVVKRSSAIRCKNCSYIKPWVIYFRKPYKPSEELTVE
jgi:hypothetical protein